MKATDRNFASLVLEPDWIRQSLQAPLPGNNAHARMSGRAPQTMQIPEGAAQAAVMIAFLDGATDEARDPKMHRGPDQTMGTEIEQSDSTPESKHGPGAEVFATNPGRFPLILRPGNQGPHSGQISLPGGTRGDVPFPHYLHQDKLEDCNICHATFPQEKGSIEKMKANGQLEKKHVMNKLCTKCHKEKKAAGEKTGPVTCKQCHIRTE